MDLIPKFAELTRDNSEHSRRRRWWWTYARARGSSGFPEVYNGIRQSVNARLIFLEADDEAIIRRFSETRRPHPLGTDTSITKSIQLRAQRSWRPFAGWPT